MEVMEDAVEPLSQSLSAVRLLLRLPGNDSTESQLEDTVGGGVKGGGGAWGKQNIPELSQTLRKTHHAEFDPTSERLTAESRPLRS